ncbi:heterodisulfide reductase-related iron-sulfur binding cluster [Salipiger bermudensis]|uniref:heterodisulfide reductase-related iron-sulfur binding cluster n=1 Tax=Salipiger bermudensis TaxID=344736 RepID=UPI003514ADE7
MFTHCTESTGAPTARRDWQEVFTALGLEIDTPATGCCGMAGMFGHKNRHQKMSQKLFDLSWAEPLARAEAAAATGFSCRCQAARLGGRALRHPLGLIADRLG